MIEKKDSYTPIHLLAKNNSKEAFECFRLLIEQTLLTADMADRLMITEVESVKCNISCLLAEFVFLTTLVFLLI